MEQRIGCPQPQWEIDWVAQEQKMGRVDSLQEQAAKLYDALSPIVKVYINTDYKLRDPRLTPQQVRELREANVQRLQQICQDSALEQQLVAFGTIMAQIAQAANRKGSDELYSVVT